MGLQQRHLTPPRSIEGNFFALVLAVEGKESDIQGKRSWLVSGLLKTYNWKHLCDIEAP